ncbi:MAG TPA: hypothetical protein VJX67_08510 [Blastocatellia bacterium]|nr:hypothetical protein [Blastocatellia bacterium]
MPRRGLLRVLDIAFLSALTSLTGSKLARSISSVKEESTNALFIDVLFGGSLPRAGHGLLVLVRLYRLDLIAVLKARE